MTRRRLMQVDVLKGVAILLVIVNHTYDPVTLMASWAVFHVWLAVPMFIVLVGFNAFGSFERSGQSSVGGLFTSRYIRRRGARVLLPFAVVWLLLWVVGAWKGRAIVSFRSLLLLRVPFGAPGNYFVPVLLALILLAPLMYAAYRRWPRATLVAVFAADLAFELWAQATGFTVTFLYSVSFLRYFGAFILGFWLADRRVSTRERSLLLILGSALSIAYTVAAMVRIPVPLALRSGNASVLSVFLPALVVWAGLRLLPEASDNPLLRALAGVGRASYHVFLFQMLYFPLFGQARPELLVVNVFMTVMGGIGFWITECWVIESVSLRRILRSRVDVVTRSSPRTVSEVSSRL